MKTDVLVIGSGLEFAAAWDAAKRGCAVTLLTRASNPQDSNTYRAQAGLFIARRRVTEQLVADILSAGAGLSSPAAASLLSAKVRAREGNPDRRNSRSVRSLTRASGELDLTSEAGHSLQRIIHYKDQTGFAIERAFFERVRSHPNVKVISDATAVDLLTASHHSVEPTDVYRPLTCVVPMFSTRRRERFFLSWPRRQSSRAVGLGASSFIRRTHRARAETVSPWPIAPGPAASTSSTYNPPDRVACAGRLLPDFRDGTWEGGRLVDRMARNSCNVHPPARSPPVTLPPRDLPTMLESGEPCVYLDITHKPATCFASVFQASMRSAWSAGSTSRANPSPLSPRPITVAAALRRTILAGPQWTAERCRRSCVHGCMAPTVLPARLCSNAWSGGRAPGRVPRTHRARRRFYFPESPMALQHEPADPRSSPRTGLTIQHTCGIMSA